MNAISPEHQRLLRPHILPLEALAEGRRKPKTAAQAHFLSVVQRRVEPDTDYERAFMAYLSMCIRLQSEDQEIVSISR